MKIKFAFLALIISAGVYAQKVPVFKERDRICFVGNSITHSGDFHHNILLYYVTRFPNAELNFFNAGISGDVTGGVIDRLENDVLLHSPNYVVNMIGMNDVYRNLYSAQGSSPENEQKKQTALQVYKANLDSIVRLVLARNINVILQKPSIYDQTAVLPRSNNFGVNDALKSCADYMELLSRKYKIPTVDYWSIMSKVNKQIQTIDSTATVVGADRVHPTGPGNLLMAYQFLKSSGAPSLVSKLVVEKNEKKSSKKSVKCSLSDFERTSNAVELTYQESSLPYPLRDDQQTALGWVPFTEDLNQEILIVRHLKPARYVISIDMDTIGVFSKSQLKQGINLVDFKTPQSRHAHNVRAKLVELWKLESDQRAIKHVEFKHLKGVSNRSDLVAVKHHLDSLYKNKYPDIPYLKTQFDKYILLKPKETELYELASKIKAEVYLINKPQPHRVKIVRQQPYNTHPLPTRKN